MSTAAALTLHCSQIRHTQRLTVCPLSFHGKGQHSLVRRLVILTQGRELQVQTTRMRVEEDVKLTTAHSGLSHKLCKFIGLVCF